MVTGKFPNLEVKDGENFLLSKMQSVALNPKRGLKANK
jgi:hypothetical protein